MYLGVDLPRYPDHVLPPVIQAVPHRVDQLAKLLGELPQRVKQSHHHRAA